MIVSSLLIHSQQCEERNGQKEILNTIFEESLDDHRVTCRYCRRRFMIERIEKHQIACETASRKRPLFNMTKQRLPNIYECTERSHSVSRYSLKLQYPNSKWQKQHLELIKKLQISCENDSSYENYLTCPYCFRKFGPIQAEKHIEKCKDIINKPKPPPSVLRQNRFPNLKKDTELAIRTKSLGSKNRSFAIDQNEQRIILNDTLEIHPTSAASSNIDISYTPITKPGFRSKIFDNGQMPPIDREYEEVISKFSYLEGTSETSQKIYTPKADHRQKSLNIAQKSKVKSLKPSKTIKALEKPDFFPGTRDMSRHSSHSRLSSNRSQSTQRLNNTTIQCRFCEASVPWRARYCMMCGSHLV